MKYNYLTIVILLLFFAITGRAQRKEIPVQVTIETLHHKDIRSFLERSTEAVFKFYHDTAIAGNCITDQCVVVKSKEEQKTVDVSTDVELKTKRVLKSFNMPTSYEAINLRMETYEDDKGEICDHDKGDDSYYITPFQLKLADLNPGVTSGPLTFTSEKEKYSAIVKLRYGIPQPADIYQEDAEAINDASKAVTLRSSIDLRNKNGLTYQWEFKTEGSDTWAELGRPTLSESVVFIAARDIFKTPVTKNQTVQLRMKAMSSEVHSVYSSPFTINFTPEAPKIFTNDITITATCPNLNSGIFNIRSVKGVADSVRYYVVKGKAVEAGNYPDVISESAKIKSGIIASNDTLNVIQLDEGEYSIVIHNPSKDVGKVFTAHQFTISKYPLLTLKLLVVDNASCDSVADGQVAVTTEGGNPAKLTYYLEPAIGKRAIEDRKVVFSELPAGLYSIIIQDECGQLVTQKNVHVSMKAAPITGEISIEKEPVNEETNGSVKVKLKGGTGAYSYRLYAANFEVKQDEANDKLQIENLPKGSYHMQVTDKSFKCAVWDTSFVLYGKTTDPITPAANTNIETSSNNESSALFTKRDNRLNFFGATQRTSVTFAGFKEEAGKNDYVIVVEKSKYLLTVLDAQGDTVVTYPVVFGNKDQGDKMFEGDRRTPEGEFEITEKKDHNKWDKIMYLNYPTSDDLKKFTERKKQGIIPAEAKIGGLIAIHGTRPDEDFEVDRSNNWTDGCVATKNMYMGQLYKYLAVGTKVVIKK